LRLHPDALVIAGDQTAVCADLPLKKPGSRERASAQLDAMQGRESSFFSAVCLMSASRSYAHVSETVVKMRALTAAEIARYIEAEQPLDCAGSFKIEALGISLFDWVRSDDPSALTGLPLIALSKGLRAFDLPLP
jgi:septum formation protein